MKSLVRKLPNFWFKYWPFLIALLLPFIFFWKYFFLSLYPFPGDFVTGVYYPWLDYKWGFPAGVPVKNPILADIPSYIYPMQVLAANLLKKGQLPLWNPHILGGLPLLANFQSAAFSPTLFLYFLFDDINAWSLQVFFQHVLVIAFTYLFIREIGISKLASVFGSVFFAFCGYSLIWSQWNGHTLAVSFIPLLLFFEYRWFRGGGVANLGGGAIAFLLQVVSGYPQSILYTGIVSLVLWIFVSKGRCFWKRSFAWGAFMLLGFGLSAFQLLPGIELFYHSQWTYETHPFEWAFLPWSKIITFIAPDYFGNHSTGNYWGPQDYTSNTGYVGIVVFVLATSSFFNKAFYKQRMYLFSFTILVLSLVLSFATPLSIFLWKKGVFGMSAASAHRALVVSNFGFCLCASYAIDYYRKNLHYLSWGFVSTFALLFGFVLGSIYLYYHFDDFHFRIALRNLVLPFFIYFIFFVGYNLFRRHKSAVLILIFFLGVFELFRFGWKFTSFSKRELIYPDTPVITFLKEQDKPFRMLAVDTMPVNFQMAYGFETIGGYETMRPMFMSKLIAFINSENLKASPASRYGIIDNETSRILDLVNTKYFLVLKENGEIPVKFMGNRFESVFEDRSTAILENKDSLPRAFMVYDWEVVEDGNVLTGLLQQDFRDKIYLDKKVYLNLAKFSTRQSVSYLYYDYQRSILDVDTGSAGILFISDSYYPGWKAYVDGVETEIIRANYAFRAIPIEHGRHTVEFVYKPQSFFLGVWVSFLSAGLIIISLLTYKAIGMTDKLKLYFKK